MVASATRPKTSLLIQLCLVFPFSATVAVLLRRFSLSSSLKTSSPHHSDFERLVKCQVKLRLLQPISIHINITINFGLAILCEKRGNPITFSFFLPLSLVAFLSVSCSLHPSSALFCLVPHSELFSSNLLSFILFAYNKCLTIELTLSTME